MSLSMLTSQIPNGHRLAFPVRKGGLGIRLVAQLAPSAFLASAVGTRSLQDLILSKCCPSNNEQTCHALALWSSWYNACAPAEEVASKQKRWDSPVVDRTFLTLLEAASTPADKAGVEAASTPAVSAEKTSDLAVSAEKSSDWLHALPVSSCGLLMNDEAVRIAVGFRLGARVYEPHACPCGIQVDARGTHCPSCRQGLGRMMRHNHINDIIWRALNKNNPYFGFQGTERPR